MKKEEQIKQLQGQLEYLLLNQKEINSLESSFISMLTLSMDDKLITNLTKEIEQLKASIQEETKEDFSDVVITSYLDSLGEIRELSQSTTIKELSKEYYSVQFLGYNTNAEKVAVCCISSSMTRHGMPMIRLFFGKKVEKPLKHPHMKDIVAKFCISAGDEFEVEKLTEMDKINWEDWDKVQPIGEDQEYGIVVKATYHKEDPNQFSLFFCEKK